MRLQPLLLALALTAALPAAPSLYDQAEAALADGDFQRARSLAGQAANSGDPSALLLKADALLAVGDKEAAAAALESAAAKLDGAAARLARGRALALQAAPTPGPKVKTRKAATTPTPLPAVQPTALPTPTSTALPTAAPTAAPTPEPSAAPTAPPTMQPTAVPAVDAAAAELEAERKALELERAQLQQEKERLALERERRALEAEREALRGRPSEESTPVKRDKDGGFSILLGSAVPELAQHMEELSHEAGSKAGVPSGSFGGFLNLGLGLHWGGIAFDNNLVASLNDAALVMPVQKGSKSFRSDGVGMAIYSAALGWDWRFARTGSVTYYLPLRLEGGITWVQTRQLIFTGPNAGASAGLGLRWQPGGSFFLDLAARYHLGLTDISGLNADNGERLEIGYEEVLTTPGGPSARLGLGWMLW